jgi:hypothetical protein
VKKATDAQIIEALRNGMGIVTQAARTLKMQRTYIHKRIRDSAELKEALEDIRDENIDLAESKLFEMIQKSDKIAIIFFLKCMGKKRGWVERQEVTGREGVPIGQIVAPVRAKSAEEWAQQNQLSTN